ncbi:DUF222 domain-containing protein [Diaminobutyricibacter sp. McL0608]|uniref:DUF222 domain-containing protein n=1 Tax=Leifsonia sp. McL0608 TaxID=3143537 RepID=UPI0031F2E59E
MTFPPASDLDRLAAAVEALRALEASAGAEADGGVCADARAGMDALGLTNTQKLVRSLAVLGAVRAAVDAVALHRIAALERERSFDPEADPVQAAGHPNVESLLAELWKTPLPAARQLCGVARATAPRHSLQGDELPAEFPDLAKALLGNGAGSEHGGEPVNAGSDTADADPGDDAGDPAGAAARVVRSWMSVAQAGVIIRELGKTGPGCGLDERAMGERALIEHAPGLTVEQLRKLAVQVRERLDQDGTEPREQMQRRRRSLTITTTRDGMTHINWYLDAESAGHVLPQLTAYVSQDYRASRDKPGSGVSPTSSDAGPAGGVRFQLTDTTETDVNNPDSDGTRAEAVMPESRTLAQLRSDGAVDAFRHLAGCSTPGSRPPVTMIVRVGLNDLRSGDGTAEIDEVPTPVSAGTARRLAADANVIPMVLGGNSEVLDLGRKQRLFSPAQKHALAERDDGCAWTGCPHPPSYAQAHHIRWWDRDTGPTDLDNGILLCSQHHHRVHDDGWDIHIRDNTPWFTPPAHHDPTRTPRPGGRIRLPESAPP